MMHSLKKTGLLTLVVLLTSSNLSFAETQTSSDWTFAGWYGGGMYPAIVPDEHVNGRLYLTSDVAGLWRSEDRGESWQFKNEGLTNLNVACLAIAPSNSDVLYAGTADGVMVSKDAGEHWKARTEEKELTFSRPVSHKAIVVHPEKPEIVYAGSKTGQIFSSDNSGEKWKAIGSTKKLLGDDAIITFLALSPDASRLLAGSKLGLLEYSISDQEWKVIKPSDKESGAYLDGFFDFQTGAFFTASEKQVYWTEDSGKNWQASIDIPKKEINRVTARKSLDGNWLLLAGWQDSAKGGIFLSRDGGRSWHNAVNNLHYDKAANPTREWMKGFSRPAGIALDHFKPDTFYYADSWALWRSDDGGKSWTEKINGAPNTTGADIAVAENGDILVSTMDQGMLVSKDGGLTYEAVLPQEGSEAGTLSGHYWRVLSFNHSEYLAGASPWHTRENQVFKGDYKSRKYQRVTSGLPDKYPAKGTFWGKGYPRALAQDSRLNNIFYLGMDGDDGGGFYYSQDSGSTWTKSKEQPPFKKIYNGLDTDPLTGRIYWAACGGRGGIYTSDSVGAKWEERFFGPTCFFDLVAAPGGIVYAAGTEKTPVLYQSRDHGEHWKLLHRFQEAAAAEAIAFDPKHPERLFVGTVNWSERAGGKIYTSANGGKDWQDISAGLPANTGPAAMAVNTQDKMLYVVLYAGGVYKRSLASIGGGGT